VLNASEQVKASKTTFKACQIGRLFCFELAIPLPSFDTRVIGSAHSVPVVRKRSRARVAVATPANFASPTALRARHKTTPPQ
jgi:hypothetical protein